ALEKGLDKGQTEFAKKMLGATYYQHADRAAKSINQGTSGQRLMAIRQQGLKDLEKAKRNDPNLPDIYLLEAKLQALPGGDDKAVATAVDEAIRLLKAKDDVKELAKAYVLRTELTDDNEKKLADF